MCMLFSYASVSDKMAVNGFRMHRRRLGNYARSLTVQDLSAVSILDLRNTWVLARFFQQCPEIILPALVRLGVLSQTVPCKLCNACSIIHARGHALDGASFRCSHCGNECTVRTNSFFKQFRFSIADMFQFIFNFLDGMSLKRNSVRAGVNYSNSAPKWAAICRKIMAERIWREYFVNGVQLDSVTEVDESVFGRKVCMYKKTYFEGHFNMLFLLHHVTFFFCTCVYVLL